MARGKKHSAEQVVNLLRQIEVAVANGPVAGDRHLSYISSEHAGNSGTNRTTQANELPPRFSPDK